MRAERGHLIISNDSEKFVYKPFSFFGDGYDTIPINEVLAYKISLGLGLSVVPHTELRCVEMGSGILEGISFYGSAQQFIPDVKPLTDCAGQKLDSKTCAEIVLLDTVIGNTDRKPDNILVDRTGKVYAIDNGFSLGFHGAGQDEKRNIDRWGISLFDLERPKLYICPQILLNADLDYLEEMVGGISEFSVAINLSEDKLSLTEEQKEFWNGIGEALRHRIKFLPTLVWKQFLPQN